MNSGFLRIAAAFGLPLLLAITAPREACGQQAAVGERTVTLLTAPPTARVALRGTSHISGPSPLDLPRGWSGRYSVSVGAPGFATGQFLLAIPSTGEAPYSLSEAPGLSPGLLFRSLNLPGVPDISSGHKERGLVLAGAAVGGALGAIRAEREHSSDSDINTVEAGDRAEDNRIYRNRWLAYAGAVWAASALDYVVRGRVHVLESSPARVTLGIPRVTHGGMFWRSLLVPGAGQEFAGQRGRGLAWLSATLASGAAYVIADFEYERDRSRLDRGEENFAGLDSVLKPSFLPALTELRKDADESRKWRNAVAAVGAGFYTLNLLDALTAPIRRDDGVGEPRLSLSAPVAPDRAALRISYRF